MQITNNNTTTTKRRRKKQTIRTTTTFDVYFHSTGILSTHKTSLGNLYSSNWNNW